MIALELHGISKSFGGLKVTSNVDISVAEGERRLIIGPNGAGKTTLFNLITGELRPDQGRIGLFGHMVTPLPTWKRAQLGMARTYQIITLFPKATLLNNVILAMMGLSHVRWRPWWWPAADGDFEAKAREILDRVGLAHLADRALSQTSYGEQRRTEIAMALGQSPRILFLDEPFAGLSIEERIEVKEVLFAIPRNVTIVMIEHDMEVALEFADRISLMHFGEIIVEGTRAEVVAHHRTREVYLGT